MIIKKPFLHDINGVATVIAHVKDLNVRCFCLQATFSKTKWDTKIESVSNQMKHFEFKKGFGFIQIKLLRLVSVFLEFPFPIIEWTNTPRFEPP